MRIEENLVLAAGAPADVENRQVLVRQSPGEEVAPAPLLRDADRVDLQELGDAPLDRVTARKGAQQRLRVLVLLVDRGTGLGGVLVFEPAVRVGDLDVAEGLL